jgi:hypothetical protein
VKQGDSSTSQGLFFHSASFHQRALLPYQKNYLNIRHLKLQMANLELQSFVVVLTAIHVG